MASRGIFLLGVLLVAATTVQTWQIPSQGHEHGHAHDHDHGHHQGPYGHGHGHPAVVPEKPDDLSNPKDVSAPENEAGIQETEAGLVNLDKSNDNQVNVASKLMRQRRQANDQTHNLNNGNYHSHSHGHHHGLAHGFGHNHGHEHRHRVVVPEKPDDLSNPEDVSPLENADGIQEIGPEIINLEEINDSQVDVKIMLNRKRRQTQNNDQENTVQGYDKVREHNHHHEHGLHKPKPCVPGEPSEESNENEVEENVDDLQPHQKIESEQNTERVRERNHHHGYGLHKPKPCVPVEPSEESNENEVEENVDDLQSHQNIEGEQNTERVHEHNHHHGHGLHKPKPCVPVKPSEEGTVNEVEESVDDQQPQQNTEDEQNTESNDENQEISRDSKQGEVQVVDCKFGSTPILSCLDCNTRLRCLWSGAKVIQCESKLKPYCNNGICSAVPGSECNLSTGPRK